MAEKESERKKWPAFWQAMERLRENAGMFRLWKRGKKRNAAGAEDEAGGGGQGGAAGAGEESSEPERKAGEALEEGSASLPGGVLEGAQASEELAPGASASMPAEAAEEAGKSEGDAAGTEVETQAAGSQASPAWLEEYRRLVSAADEEDGAPETATNPGGIRMNGERKANAADWATYTRAQPAAGGGREDKLELLLSDLREEMRAGFQALQSRRTPTVFS